MNYDYMGRRIEKKSYGYAGGFMGEFELQSHHRYVYDGYKLVEELDALNNNDLIRRYTWQPDATGLDVPLSVYDATLDKTYYYHTDSNKNVTELTDETGNVIAHYEYSPFGQISKQSGSYAETNPFRFSSEYYDSEIKLIYYNYRHYDPELGRWLNRDPIAEEGGINLYNFVENSPIGSFDFLGLNSVAATLAIAIAQGNVSMVRFILSEHAYMLSQAAIAAATAFLAKAAYCKGQYDAYKSLKCKGCNDDCITKEEALANAACLNAEIAGRLAYLANGCDQVLAGNIKRGVSEAITGHLKQVEQKQKALTKCLQKAME